MIDGKNGGAVGSKTAVYFQSQGFKLQPYSVYGAAPIPLCTPVMEQVNRCLHPVIDWCPVQGANSPGLHSPGQTLHSPVLEKWLKDSCSVRYNSWCAGKGHRETGFTVAAGTKLIYYLCSGTYVSRTIAAVGVKSEEINKNLKKLDDCSRKLAALTK